MERLVSKSVLLVDDNASTLRSLKILLERKGFTVTTALTADEALNLLDKGGARPSFVILDQVLDGRKDGGTRAAKRISDLHRDCFIVMYTADPEIEEVEKWRSINAGAHRFIIKGSAEELLRDFNEVIEDMHELKELTREIGEISQGRLSMFSALVGLDAKLTIVDKEYKVWFSTDMDAVKEQGEVGGVVSPCWVFFHGFPVESGPCASCNVRSVISNAEARQRTLLVRSRKGGLEWIRNDTIPVVIPQADGALRVLAARESTQRLGDSINELSADSRLQCISESIILAGFNAVRIYRVLEDVQIRCAAVATSLAAEDDRRYKSKALGFTTSRERNRYMEKAYNERLGTLNFTWDKEIGPDTEARVEFGLRPPWIDLPLWQGENLVGWIAADLPEGTSSESAHSQLEVLKMFSEETIRALSGRRSADLNHSISSSVLARARLELNRAQDASEAITAIMQFAKNLVEEYAQTTVIDVRVRVHEDGRLRILKRLSPESRQVEADIFEDDVESFAAYVARFRHPHFVNDRVEYEARSQEYNLPRGKYRGVRDAIAILPLEVQGVCLGSLHVECVGALDWEASGLKDPLSELAGMLSILLRDFVVNRQLADAKRAVERELREVFGSVHGVRGPIQAVRNAFELIIDYYDGGRLDGDTLKEIATTARRAISRIERLPHQLLRLSGEAQRSLMCVSPSELLRQLVQEWAPLYPHIEVVVDIKATRLVEANPQDMREAFEEVFLNSLRAGATVYRITLCEANEVMAIKLEDNGSGIALEKAERIFEQWYTEFPEGNGLGLPFVRAVIERTGGEVWAEPLEQGLRIMIHVPFIGDRHA